MCEYCRNDGKEHTIFNDDINHWHTIFMNDGKLYIFHRRRGFWGANGIDVENCPMCGRKLSEDDMREQIEELTRQLTELEVRLSESEKKRNELSVTLSKYREENYRLSERIVKSETDIKEWQKKCEELEEQLKNPAETEDDICTMSPLQVAEFLIEHKTHIEETTNIFGVKYPSEDVQTFEIQDLKQIAEHLLVYCRHNKENEE